MTKLSMEGILLFELEKYDDERGYFFEVFNRFNAPELGFGDIKQINFSLSGKNVVRGLHYQKEPRAQAKLIHVTEGSIFDVAVDLRKKSPSFLKWTGVELISSIPKTLFIPVGFAHGFCVTSDFAKVLYCVSETYDPSCERGIAFDDAEIGIKWPVSSFILSEKDKKLPTLGGVKDFF